MAIGNLRPLSYVIITIAFALGTISIFLRLYCRWRLRAIGRDDMVVVFLFFVNTMQQAILYIFLYYGCGLPANRAPPDISQKITKWLFIEEVFYMFVHFTLKQAFLVFYLRLSPKISFKRTVYATMAICTLFLIIEWLLAFLQARPLAAMFHPTAYPNAKHLSQYVVQMVPTALNAFSDIVILVLPVPTVLKLQMSTRQKIAVLAIICFGSLSVVTALCRFAVQEQLITWPDTPYVMGHMIIVAGIEIEVAVVAVNLPALRCLFTKLAGSSHDPSSYHQGAHRLSSMKSESHRPRKGFLVGASRKSHENLGATLSGSEEELMRRQGGYSDGNIKVVTNVDVSSQRATDDNHPAETAFSVGRI